MSSDNEFVCRHCATGIDEHTPLFYWCLNYARLPTHFERDERTFGTRTGRMSSSLDRRNSQEVDREREPTASGWHVLELELLQISWRPTVG